MLAFQRFHTNKKNLYRPNKHSSSQKSICLDAAIYSDGLEDKNESVLCDWHLSVTEIFDLIKKEEWFGSGETYLSVPNLYLNNQNNLE